MSELPPPVRYEQDNGIAVITLNRVEKKNAINLAMARLIQGYLQRAEQDDAVQVIVLTGLPQVFSAGMDVKAFQQGELPLVEPGGFAGLVHAQLTKVIIAAVDGIAFGGGFEIALACDLIVASPSAQFSFPETGLGLIAAQGGCSRLPARISPYIALDWLLTGRIITALEAWQQGAISRISEGSAREEALTIARQIAQKNPLASQAVKAIVRHGLTQHEAPIFDYQQSWVEQVRRAAKSF
ncbi:enoyl-CoA hydratase-related protein [Pseudomonas lundensis]|uniref:enoyl-CoA hydratase-related protein n=1 Tax=Serratia proteamaculans TaxID=28151 RepID=UPI002981DBBB|nr:enoyl-CoA hydratase-related protein [Serratia proteamaculans]MDW5499792.1 enoyl-CoA hydratase-related protein [Serratia proteamaculans]MDW5504857.1 enoyl-CoA hydratase-related protein [Pseudomonas lundensis]